MPSLLEIGLANAACATVLAALVLLAGRLCRRPAIMHGLWLLVLLKLVTPPLVPLRLPVLPMPEVECPVVALAPPPKRAQPPVEEPVTTGQFLMLPSSDNGELVVAVKLNTTPWVAPLPVEEVPSAIVLAPAELRGVDWRTIARMLTAGWVGGAAVWFAMAIVRTWRFQRLLRFAMPIPVELRERAELLAARLGLTRCPRIALVPGPMPPMLWMSIGRPTIYLPADLLSALEPREVDSLLAHELAHLRRRDHWVRWLEFFVQGLYWWNPLVPLVRRAVQAHEEECCDALAVTVVAPRPYATAIVRTLDFLAGVEPLAVPASGLSRVAAMKRRLTQIMCGGVAGRLGMVGRVTLAGLALTALPLLPTLTHPIVEAASANEPVAVIDEAESNEIDDIEDVDGTEAPSDDAAPRAMAYSPDGSLVVIALQDGGIEVREPMSNRVVRRLRGHVGPVNAVAFAPDGRRFATAGSDRTVRLWSASDGSPIATLRGHTHWVYALAFAPDGRTLASGGYDRTIKLWNVEAPKCVATLRGHEGAVRTLAFAPDGRTIAGGGADSTIRLWETASRRLQATLTGHGDTVRAVAFAPDGRTLASAGDDGTVRSWDPQTATEVASWSGHPAEVTSLAFAPWGQVLATAGHDRVTRLWSVPDGQAIGVLPAPRDGIVALAWSPRSGALTTLGHDRQLRHLNLTRVEVLAASRAGRELNDVPKPAEFRRLAARVKTSAAAPQMVLVEFVRNSKGVRTVE